MVCGRALERLQNPEDTGDVIVLNMLRLLRGDGSSEVRRAVLQTITITKASLADILLCTRDIREDIRVSAYREVSIEEASISILIFYIAG